MILTFGKHEGRAISNPKVSYGYLDWIRQQPWCAVVLKDAIAQELARPARVAEKDSIPARRPFGSSTIAQIKGTTRRSDGASALDPTVRKRFEI